MAPKKKEHNNDLTNPVIQHYQNGDSQREIAAKTLLLGTTVEYMIEKYKSTKCIGNLFGRGRRRKTTATTDRLIQRKVKLDRRKSASSVKVKIENELGIPLHVLKSRSTGRFQQENTGNQRNVEAVFRSEIFRTFFRRVPINSCSFRQETAGNHLEKIRNNFRLEYGFRFPLISRIFLREPAISSSLPCRFLQYPVTGMIVLDRYNSKSSA